MIESRVNKTIPATIKDLLTITNEREIDGPKFGRALISFIKMKTGFETLVHK